MDALLSLVLGLLLGILASILAGVWLSYHQFESSIAGYRVRMVAEATPQFIEAIKLGNYAGRLDNKYRPSLGGILGEFAVKFGGKDFPENGPWPRLVDPEKDRWESFNERVRPVMDDINVYAFVAHFPGIFLRLCDKIRLCDQSLLEQLAKLTELCQQLETVVGELDAAFEGAQKDASYRKEQGAIYPSDLGDPEAVIKLVQEHRELHRIWTEWRELVGS